jgi:putative spermidine/putrescine transport system permease protein
MTSRISTLFTRFAFNGAIAVVYLLIFAPVVAVIVISFFSNEIISFPPDNWTIRWYINAWEKRDFARGMLTSVQVALLSSLIGVSVGTAAAIGLARSTSRYKPLITNILMGPLAVPSVVAGAALYMGYLRMENWLDEDITGIPQR